MLFFGIRMRIRIFLRPVEHGTVIGRTEKGRLTVKLDNRKTKILNDEEEPIQDANAAGYFIYTIRKRVIAFDRDFF